MDKIDINIQRINSHEYVVSSAKAVYYISKDDGNIYWHVFNIKGFAVPVDPLSVHHQLEKAVDWAYAELFKL